jgi:molybdopterin-binding aldehyde dehydrogenase-like protein
MNGRGIAYVHYKQAETYVAMGVDAEVEQATGAVRVLKVACAHDCGLMINPDAVRAQVEGSILQTLSRTLFEEVTFDRSRVTSTDWASYPILTFPDVPKLDIALIDRRHERPLGVGEARPRRWRLRSETRSSTQRAQGCAGRPLRRRASRLRWTSGRPERPTTSAPYGERERFPDTVEGATRASAP